MDLAEGLPLVEAKIDKEPSGVSLQGGVANDPLHPVEVERVGRAQMVRAPIYVIRHLPADEPLVVWVACEDRAVAICNGERGTRRDTLPRDVVGEPIQAESGYDDAAHAAIGAIERQHKMKDVAAGFSTDRELPDRERAGFQDIGEVGPPGGGRSLSGGR